MSDPRQLISIVLPVHNGERFLRESIDSCLRQTWSNLELIVVNDASTDGTEAIVQSYLSDPRVRYTASQQPLRLPGALNRGFSQARGAYLTWTSDDNYYEPQALEVMVRELMAQPRLGMVYSDENWVDENGTLIDSHQTLHPDYLIECCVPGGSFMYASWVKTRVGDYEEKTFLAEDYDYWLRIYLAGIPMKRLPVVLYNYRKHAGALGSLYVDKVNDMAQKVRDLHLSQSRLAWLRTVRRCKVLLGLISRRPPKVRPS